MKVDRLPNFKSPAFPKIWKKKKSTTLPIQFPFSLQLGMYHTPLTWYEEENLEHMDRFEATPRTVWFLRQLLSKDGSQRHCASVVQAGTRVHRTPNSAIFGSAWQQSMQTKRNVCVRLATAYADKTECAVCYQNVSWYSLTVSSARTPLSLTYILSFRHRAPSI